jgi:hypothetical protein
MTRASISLAVLFGLTAQAVATELPIYDVDKRCSVFRVEYQSKQCVRDEQNSYDFLTFLWSDINALVSDKNKSNCIERTSSAAAYNYRYLSDCILPYLDAARTIAQPPFRR